MSSTWSSVFGRAALVALSVLWSACQSDPLAPKTADAGTFGAMGSDWQAVHRADSAMRVARATTELQVLLISHTPSVSVPRASEADAHVEEADRPKARSIPASRASRRARGR